MKPKIVHARDKKVMDQLMELFIESKYKIQSSDWNYVLLKRNYYGNYAIHIVFLIIALVLNAWAIVINVIYFGYSLFGKSNVVLITTETLDENGNLLEFDDVEDIQVFYSQETWDKAIELSKLE